MIISRRQGAFARRAGWIVRRLPLGVGWCWGTLLAFNLLGEWARPRFDATAAWLPLAEADGALARLLMGATAALVLWAMVRPPVRAPRYVATQAVILFWLVLAVLACLRQFETAAALPAHPGLPVPYVALTVVGLAALAWHLRRVHRAPPDETLPPEARIFAGGAAAALVALVFTWGQFFLFGPRDLVEIPRSVDCIIVMGSGVRPDGTPSVSLYDRTRAGCDLYTRGYGKALIFSGGPVTRLDDDVSAARAGLTEAQVMREIAGRLGVPPECCLLDDAGRSTFWTVVSCRQIMRRQGWRTAVVVSHDYHLSRTALAFHRGGQEVCTHAAARSRINLKDFTVVARESAAWVYYYFRPLWQPLDGPPPLEGTNA